MRRTSVISALFLVASLSAVAQDPTMVAMQQAQDSFTSGISRAAKPSFSVKPGTYTGAVTVRLRDRSRGSAIYYTTDGWTPTTLSNRYVGPITLNATTNLQAIAIANSALRSPVASALYVVANPAHASPATSERSTSSAPSVELTFTGPVTSHGLKIGDALPVALGEDLYIGGVLVAPKAALVLVTVTQVDGPGRSGLPASLSFAARSVSAGGRTILLAGTEATDGKPHTRKANAVGGIPFVGISSQFVKGGDVRIASGATFKAHVVAGEPQASSTR